MHTGDDTTVHDPSLIARPRSLPLPLLPGGALNALSVIYKTVSLILLKLKSLNQKHYPEVFIISVDNLSFGGTGKTTLVTEIARHLEKNHIKFAIVMRGYKSQFENKGIKVQPHHNAREVGDEANLFRTRFPGQDIYVGKNRRRSIGHAIRDKNKIILLDDGFQTTNVYKDFKIMLVNPRHPFYYLRNFKFLMNQEDVLLFYKTPAKSKCDKYWQPGGPVCGTYDFDLEHFYDAEGKEADSRVFSASIVGFSALGDNWRFRGDLSRFQGVQLVDFHGFRDHHAYSEEEINALNRRRIALKADYLVCTEKDFIKIKYLDLLNFRQIPLIYVRNSIKFNVDLIGHIMMKYAKKNEQDNR
jgi:tetraacyldisaccharide 4'-kinase